MRLGRQLGQFRLAWFALLATVCAGSLRADTTVIEWRFDTDGDLEGWSINGHIGDGKVAGGVLTGKTIDWDPILVSPVFDIAATPLQHVELKIRTGQAGGGQLFWTETLEGQYGGFSQTKSVSFHTEAVDGFQVVRIYPFWHAAQKVVRLRIDPPSTGAFAIDSVRIAADDTVQQTDALSWRFDTQLHGWRAWQQMTEPNVQQGQLHVTCLGKTPMLMSPLLAVPADENPYVAVRMSVAEGGSGRVFCVSSTQFGWEEVTFPLRADGKMHSYNIDVGYLRQWCDQILMIGIQPTDVAGAEASIESIAIATDPQGPPELTVDYFGPAEGINRVDCDSEITLCLRNLGGETARSISALLDVPDGVQIIGGQQRQVIPQLTYWLPESVSWRVKSARPRTLPLKLTLEGATGGVTSAESAIVLTAAPAIPAGPYIPEPQPVKSPFEVGVFYFPGWSSMSRWQPILDYPMRKPVLGWYDEANPECADWQIKWAVEHGVDFFMVDWYWCQGKRHLEHWLHDAYGKAHFRKYLKWCVMWANHNPPNTHSAEDWRQVTQYWIDNYFQNEEYYRIDGRPAVFIWAPANIRNDVGGSERATELYAMSQQMARDAGLPGIYFVAMSSHDSEATCRQLKAEGYEAFTSYHAFQLAAQRSGSKSFPFSDVVETSPQVWQEADQRSAGLLYMPLIDTGWSSEPWHGNKSLIISDRTPEQFGRLCAAAREYCDRTAKRIVTIGPWNEWGEGSYIEPYAEYGFQDLDQLRAAFCPPTSWPPNIIPSDIERGPYDLPLPVPQSEWQFNTDGDWEGWMANGYITAEIRGGLLVGETNGTDPILNGPGVRIVAGNYRRLVVRMRSTSDDRAQLFWSTTTASQSEGNSLRFDVIGDGKFHDYEVDLRQSSQWRGMITSLRFDPANRAGVSFAVDFIRFQ